jgi:GNAT superfamily N-acetyltransferase
MSVRVVWETRWEALREEDRAEIIHWRRTLFPQRPDEPVLAWEPHALGGVVVYCDEHVASFLKIVGRTIRADGVQVRAGGVSGVMTIPDYRRRGLAGLALAEARRVIFETVGAEVGLLLCLQRLLSFYERYGWAPFEGEVVFDQPGGKRTWHNRCMVLVREGARWDPKRIDLCGLPW